MVKELVTPHTEHNWGTDTQRHTGGVPCDDGGRCICKPRTTKDWWQPPEPRREAWKRLSLRASRRNLDFGLPALRIVIFSYGIPRNLYRNK